MEILEPMDKSNLAVLNADSSELWDVKDTIIPKTVFLDKGGRCKGKNIKSDDVNGLEFDIYGCYGEMTFRVPLPGIHNVNNALAAIVVGFQMGLSQEEIQRGLLNLKLPEMRLQFKKSYFGADIIDDSYNASPDSMKAALDLLSQRGQGKRCAGILGDMLELGEYSQKYHFGVGKYAAERADVLIAVGSFTQSFKAGALQGHLDSGCIYTFTTVQEAAREVIKIVEDCDIILVKASRGMKLEQITQILVRRS